MEKTSYFDRLAVAMVDNGLSEEVSTPAKPVVTTKDIRAMLDKMFSCIDSLEKYNILIDVIASLRDHITLKFLTIMFDALAPMEERVWANEGYPIPVQEIYNANSHLLLDCYKQFAFDYNRDITDYAKSHGITDTAAGQEFLAERTAIYSKYIILAGEVIDPNIMEPFSCDSTGINGAQ